MDGDEALRLAGVQFGARLALVESADWASPTPCEEWSVRGLVNHVVGGNFRYVMILRNETPADVLASHDVDWLGTDPRNEYMRGLEEVQAAFEVPGVLGATVLHPKSGPMLGAQLRFLRVNELTIHAWDLARSIGSDDRLDVDLVGWLYDRILPIREWFAYSGLYAPTTDAATQTDRTQEGLLRLLGRLP